MNIGIIGAGNIGATLARKLSGCGHTIKLANSKGPESIQDLATSIGVAAVTKEEAVVSVDVVILSIPFAKYQDLSTLFNGVPDHVVVIDTSNYYPMRDGAIAEVDNGQPESLWVSEQIGRPVVKAWNAVLAATLSDLGQPPGTSTRIAIPVAGNDVEAVKVAQDLVEDTGFTALPAGQLIDSWRQQPGTPAYCTDLTLPELQSALQKADKDRAPKNRDALMSKFMSATTQLSHEDVIATNRAGTV